MPLAYERLYGQPLELDHTTVVSLGSCNDIPKALSVLKAMDIKACAIADLDFAFTEARRGGTPLLPKEGEDIGTAKVILQRLRPVHGFSLAGNGLPQNQGAWKAADVWAMLAQEIDGQQLLKTVHEQLKGCNIWVWTDGCIENVTGASNKGENAIAEQEERLLAMSAIEIEQQMPAFAACFAWIRSL